MTPRLCLLQHPVTPLCCGRCEPRVARPAHRGNQRAAAPTRTAWRARGGGEHRWRSRLDDAPAPQSLQAQPSIPRRSCCQIPPLIWGREEALSGLSRTLHANRDKPLSSEAGCGEGTARALTWRSTKPPASVPSAASPTSILLCSDSPSPRQG